MTSETADLDRCAVCAKHRGRGPLAAPLVYADDLVVVTHRLRGARPGVVPGYLFVEPRRHVAGLGLLSAAEARAVADAAWRGARALEAELAPRHVFSMIAGRSVPHLHQHLFARPWSVPDHIPWHDADSGATELLDGPGVDALCVRLARWFG
ncbi:HIT family protein [Nocardia thailandica]|uniref:HIT family protein n=1 Tax=Nocardia thailandica TaxID=257275 RepID=UPI0002DB916F|nr:HIT domain-containing protein [Nocardia thailandica]